MRALILVDVQRDFLPGGRLAVPDGDAILPLLNSVQRHYDAIVMTQDWHPQNHLSFASNHPGRRPLDTIDLDGIRQVLWPDHCVWDSPGACFADGLNYARASAIVRKGMDPRVDSYSGFFDNGRRHKTGLAEWLRGVWVDEVHVAGLAAEYCVTYTARDAAELGFQTALMSDGTRALSTGDFETAAAELRSRGVIVAPSAELIRRR